MYIGLPSNRVAEFIATVLTVAAADQCAQFAAQASNDLVTTAWAAAGITLGIIVPSFAQTSARYARRNSMKVSVERPILAVLGR